ncbi:hypothetical protein [Bradyrhizobium sp. CB3481]|uniref:hypothetical protein n=1 Tax=Bradyrhizobium sp. CB3481 TaxID=3039158 RepID=UPI0024B27144|nr:hypothetical protein [Bradyrhizobium sp. CB3481]WFU14444.1 hypothetical protein QA643_25045 [Bradyrhizobium sp. CB3481]
MRVLLGLTIGVLLLLLTSQFPRPAYSQQSPALTNPASSPSPSDQRISNPPPPAEQKNTPEQRSPTAYLTYKTPYEFWLTALTILLLIVMGGMLCLMAYTGTLTPEFYKAFLILVVVFSALFLIVAGYTDQQTAPVFGLLGTIAGYIFGRLSSTPDGQAGVQNEPNRVRAEPARNGNAVNAGAEPPRDGSPANTTGVALGDLPR